jgi:hypothetical protein
VCTFAESKNPRLPWGVPGGASNRTAPGVCSALGDDRRCDAGPEVLMVGGEEEATAAAAVAAAVAVAAEVVAAEGVVAAPP